jgi:hypothetical protein
MPLFSSMTTRLGSGCRLVEGAVPTARCEERGKAIRMEITSAKPAKGQTGGGQVQDHPADAVQVAALKESVAVESVEGPRRPTANHLISEVIRRRASLPLRGRPTTTYRSRPGSRVP